MDHETRIALNSHSHGPMNFFQGIEIKKKLCGQALEKHDQDQATTRSLNTTPSVSNIEIKDLA